MGAPHPRAPVSLRASHFVCHRRERTAMGRFARRPVRCWSAALAATVGMTIVLGTSPAAAAAGFTASALSASTSGTLVTAAATIGVTSKVSATLAGVCARNSGGGVVDFPLQAATLTPSGTTFQQTRSLAAGTYTYWACAKVSGAWHDIGTKKSFSVGVDSTAPSGQAMPKGDLPGWRQTFTEDFTTNVAMGGFPGPYAHRWDAYNGFKDSSGNGRYSRNIISTHGGMLDMYLHTENGIHLGAAPIPLINNGKWGGQVYGRYSIRFKSDALPGYGAGWLLWPDSGDWNDGEIDFPEGYLNAKMQGFNHTVGNARVNHLVVSTGVTWTSWHTATVDWKPTGVSFILDGKTLATDTGSIPRKPLRWVLQTATSGPLPSASTAGHVLIDWVAVYAYAG